MIEIPSERERERETRSEYLLLVQLTRLYQCLDQHLLTCSHTLSRSLSISWARYPHKKAMYTAGTGREREMRAAAGIERNAAAAADARAAAPLVHCCAFSPSNPSLSLSCPPRQLLLYGGRRHILHSMDLKGC